MVPAVTARYERRGVTTESPRTVGGASSPVLSVGPDTRLGDEIDPRVRRFLRFMVETALESLLREQEEGEQIARGGSVERASRTGAANVGLDPKEK